MNKKAFFGVVGVLAASLVLGTLFQNCANSAFDNPSAEEVAVVLANDKNPPAVTVDSNATITRETGTGVIGGTCEPTAGPVAISMGTLGQSLAECGPNGKFEVCYVIPRLGNGTLEIKQYNTTRTETSQTARTEVYVTTTVSTSIRFEIISIQVLTPSTGKVTIKCIPGSNIESTIYGAQQLPANTSCPANGELTFNVGLVSGLAGTGQRVVYVKQVTQSGQVTTVFADADNVTKTHACSITLTTSNGRYCADRMGNVLGSCKGGSPVEIKINGKTQSVVTCSIDNTFEAKDVVLTEVGSNTVTISQKTPFGTTCNADKILSTFTKM